MARLPIRRKRSKAASALQVAKSIAKVWTSINLASAGARAAKSGAKAYGTAKGAKVAGRPVLKLLLLPAAAAGGFVAFRKLRGPQTQPGEQRDYSGVEPGPTVQSPASTSSDGESGLTDTPAGAVNPPTAAEPTTSGPETSTSGPETSSGAETSGGEPAGLQSPAVSGPDATAGETEAQTPSPRPGTPSDDPSQS